MVHLKEFCLTEQGAYKLEEEEAKVLSTLVVEYIASPNVTDTVMLVCQLLRQDLQELQNWLARWNQ